MKNPYQDLPQAAYWRAAVADINPLSIGGLWSPIFPIDADTRIVTAGSCFAQHIGKALANAGYNWFVTEPAAPSIPKQLHKTYGYGVFSFRTGNIYTAALLRQWVSWALGLAKMPEEVWEQNGRFFDPFRPAIEPNGFASLEEIHALRQSTLAAILRAIKDAGLWIFTLGLTEAWRNASEGYFYPVCPGTIAGQFDPTIHAFQNFRHAEIYGDLIETFAMLKNANAGIKVMLTVSPVPLAATASGRHVLLANEYSKSTLRAVANDVKTDTDNVDYFPAYEIITGFPFRGIFFEPNLRNVSVKGVDFVMQAFFQGLGETQTINEEKEQLPHSAKIQQTDDDIACEEALLEAFGEK